MNVKTGKRPSRRYDTTLRREQGEATRDRILAALVRTMGRGAAGLSVPALAREAGVSVPTVYRYYRTKPDLMTALGPYLVGKAGLMRPPSDADDLGSIALDIYRRHEGMDETMRAAFASELGAEVRRRTMPERIAVIRKEVRRLLPGIARRDQERLARVLLIFMSSAVVRAFESYLGMGPAKAGDDVAWVLRVIERGLKGKGR